MQWARFEMVPHHIQFYWKCPRADLCDVECDSHSTVFLLYIAKHTHILQSMDSKLVKMNAGCAISHTQNMHVQYSWTSAYLVPLGNVRTQNAKKVKSKGFWQWCITLRITALMLGPPCRHDLIKYFRVTLRQIKNYKPKSKTYTTVKLQL
jgi:hypothetical protein